MSEIKLSNPLPSFTKDFRNYSRWLTREVKIGHIALGSNNPIRVQSMTTTDTMDTLGTIQQTIRMVESGCEYVRITAPSLKDARNLTEIKRGLKKEGFDVPLIADIHFTPNAAEEAARIVEKVRVNPGNYADKKKFNQIEYSDSSYEEEIERIGKRFTPLVNICKEYGTAMRIGTNHGSLSDRILSRYGDTPKGMVESALEFVRICEGLNYHDIVLSMKASNPKVMVQAYRMLVSQMKLENMNYPLHLGVTEAGDGEDGRIKSALGIGALLEDGLGDTVRVSLTEDPEVEAPVARSIISRYAGIKEENKKSVDSLPIDFNNYIRRSTKQISNIGSSKPPVVIVDFSGREEIKPANLFGVGYVYSKSLDKWTIQDMAVDYLYLGDQELNFEIPGTLSIIQNYEKWLNDGKTKPRFYPYLKVQELPSVELSNNQFFFLEINLKEFVDWQSLKKLDNAICIFKTSEPLPYKMFREAFGNTILAGINNPIIIGCDYSVSSLEELQLYSSVDIGALFLDGMGDGVFVRSTNTSIQNITSLSFGILQATRTRISKTEYISCPSCGRTLFDLQETTAKIRSSTSHLKGIKIGIMGCIVNGPGEMADADYGYVGTGKGKISLYKEQEVIVRNVPEIEAVEALIKLIQDNGDWVEPT